MASAPSSTEPSPEGDARSRLLSAAGPVFACHGFERATVREICTSAEVNVASVAYYFGDKMGLYRAVIEQVRDARERRFPAPTFDDVDPRLMMYRLVHTMLSRMLAADSSGWESQLLMREMQQQTSVFERMVREFFRPLYDTVTATIRALIGDEAESHTIDQLALGVVGQCVYYRFGAGVVEMLISQRDRDAHYDIDSLALHITTVTLAACDARAYTQHRHDLIRCLESEATVTNNTSSTTTSSTKE